MAIVRIALFERTGDTATKKLKSHGSIQNGSGLLAISSFWILSRRLPLDYGTTQPDMAVIEERQRGPSHLDEWLVDYQ